LPAAIVLGKVTDANTGLPIEGATVTLDAYRTITDADGGYMLSVPPGTYTLTCAKTGYKTYSETVTLAEGETRTINIALTPKAKLIVESRNVNVGEVFTLNIDIADVSNLAAYSLAIKYDQTMLSCQKVEAILWSESEVTRIREDYGAASVTAASLTPFTGSTTLARITFQAIKEGTSTVELKGVIRIEDPTAPETYQTGLLDSNYNTIPYTATAGTITAEAPFDFSISITPISGTVIAGQSTSATVTVNVAAGTPSTVNLSASVDNPPAEGNINVSLSETSGVPPFTITLNITTTVDVPPGTYTITVTGASSPPTHAAQYVLTVEPPPALPATVTGKVTDANTGLPIEGATVSINNYATTTDADGNYTLSVPAGTYTLTCAKTGYETYSETVTLAEGDVKTINIALTPSPSPPPPPTHTLTVNSTPIEGVTFTIDTTTAKTPYTATLEEKSYTITMPQTWTDPATGKNYQFKNWEDGTTNPTRTINLTADMTITATYEEIPAPPTATVTGTVKGILGMPVSNAKITINGYTATTDKTGTYRIEGIPLGTYTLKAEHWLYETYATPLELIEAKTYTVDITLTIKKLIVGAAAGTLAGLILALIIARRRS